MKRLYMVAVMGFLSTLFGCGNRDADQTRYVSDSAYRENLAKQTTMSPMTLEQLRKYGVTDETNLKLEFFFYTDDEAKASGLAKVLAERSYSVEHGQSTSDDDRLIVTGWTTRMSMDESTVVQWTREMCELGFEHDCEFDGWGTKPDQN